MVAKKSKREEREKKKRKRGKEEKKRGKEEERRDGEGKETCIINSSREPSSFSLTSLDLFLSNRVSQRTLFVSEVPPFGPINSSNPAVFGVC